MCTSFKRSSFPGRVPPLPPLKRFESIRRDHGFEPEWTRVNSMRARARALCVCVRGFKSGIVKLTLCEMDFMRIFWITVDIFWKPFEEMKSFMGWWRGDARWVMDEMEFGGIERFISNLWRIFED